MNTVAINKDQTYTSIPSQKIFLWIAIVSIIMLFAGLTSGYIVRQAEGNWVHFELPKIFYLSTAFIVISSLFMQWALWSAKKNHRGNLLTGLIITLGLGLAFSFAQFLGWTKLVEMKVFFGGVTANPSGSFLYVLTGLHLAHLAGGLIYLLFVITNSIRGKYNSEYSLPIQLCAIYWHFLDILWVYLFIFLLTIR
ncbi:MAG TPA: cytochrome c oxidase subunit 3 [Bacteroidia bacterium]|nr:cytochrome c oxidase subunit 3 [Bacteroidia bacterium]